MTTPRTLRRALVLAAALAAALTSAWAPAAAAPAKVTTLVDAQCLGGFSRVFTPPITTTPQTVSATATYSYGTCLVGPTATGTVVNSATLSCVPVVPGVPPETEVVTWLDGTGDTSTVAWSNATVVGQTVVLTGAVTAGRHLAASATKVTSGISYVGSVVGCLLGTPIASTTGVVDSFLLTG
ncbi:hypothetical protein [Actinokineospora cianjurensis]|uniref:Ig-like domain-containing protein n=1 Tax=Actinokineospora cianjurensis TaxID=585224 RepID=A0A421AXH0_9PSEU|nr:hypothetical protein [Actinokineospora cianjurensis]RLK54552.1 hypothetical protein CLV68_5585 [Actinokineospora cianjurensis]